LLQILCAFACVCVNDRVLISRKNDEYLLSIVCIMYVCTYGLPLYLSLVDDAVEENRYVCMYMCQKKERRDRETMNYVCMYMCPEKERRQRDNELCMYVYVSGKGEETKRMNYVCMYVCICVRKRREETER